MKAVDEGLKDLRVLVDSGNELASLPFLVVKMLQQILGYELKAEFNLLQILDVFDVSHSEPVCYIFF